MSSSSSAPLVLTPSELKALPQATTIPIDVTWFMPNVTRDPNAEFTQKRLPHARFWSLDGIASKHPLGLGHMMPNSETFAEACESMGINPESHVVFYDTHGVFSSPRALLMFKAFGHKNASILNGGLPGWEVEGYDVESGTPVQSSSRVSYPAPQLDQDSIRDYDAIVANAKKDPSTSQDAELVLDARPNARFLGTAPEPRPGLSSGHIPHSISVPFSTLLETHTIANSTNPPKTYTTLLPPSELRKVLSSALGPQHSSLLSQNAPHERKIVTSCGSGMTASIIWLALQQLGVSAALYDESWTGYAMREESVIHKNHDYSDD